MSETGSAAPLTSAKTSQLKGIDGFLEDRAAADMAEAAELNEQALYQGASETYKR